MTARIPDFRAAAERSQRRLGRDGAARLLDAGRAWNLAPVLEGGGAVIFPHVSLEVCGHHTAAAVHACLDSGADRVLVLGVLHALTDELEQARVRVADGGDRSTEDSWGIQGPFLSGRIDWTREFSLSNFLFLWHEETTRRGIEGPELTLRYPYLAGGRPGDLPGIEELERVTRGSVVVATANPFHHGIGYGDTADEALSPEARGLELARRRRAGPGPLRCAGEPVPDRGHLLGPVSGRVLDIVADDMSGPYNAPSPTWVAGALIELASQTPHY